jgi:uncharacterized membrane protein YhaH (DUF805 family)
MDYENPYASPLADTTTPAEARHTERKDLGWLLFSFQGRIPRRKYWAVMIVSWFIANLLVIALVLPMASELAVVLILGFVLLPLYWIFLAVAVKRWHDRDKSGWWVLISLVPYVGPIWMLIECGCLRGTVGPNFYGDDPT